MLLNVFANPLVLPTGHTMDRRGGIQEDNNKIIYNCTHFQTPTLF